MTTQGEKIAEIGTSIKFIVDNVKDIKETVNKINDSQALFVTKSEFKEELKDKAGLWTETWVKGVAFVVLAAILIEIFNSIARGTI